MRHFNRLVIAGALVLLVAAIVWLLREGAGGEPGRNAVVLGRAPVAADAPGFVGGAERGSDAAAPSGLDVAAAPFAEANAADASASPSAPTAADGSVAALFRGRVVDDVGVPIASATVVYWPGSATLALYGLDSDAYGAALDVLPRVTTDGDGRFELQGRHKQGTGWLDAGDDPMLVVLSGELATLSRLCRGFAGGTFDAGDLALEPGARLSGRVVDGSDRPIAGATIELRPIDARSLRGVADRMKDWGFDEHAGAFAATISGADGRFVSGPLWDGSVQLACAGPGYLEVLRDNVPVKVGQANDVGDIVLSAGAALTGVVRDAQHAPVAGARVVAWEAYDSHIPVQDLGAVDSLVRDLLHHEHHPGVLTDATGRFLVPDRPATNHSLLVDAAGFEPSRMDELLPGQADVSLTLVRAAALRLTVLDAATRHPIATAVVHAWRLSGIERDRPGLVLPVRASDGAFIVERLGRKRTEVVIEAPGYATASLALVGATPPEERAQTVELVREARVTGVVMDANGTPIASATVTGAPRQDGAPPSADVHATSDTHAAIRAQATTDAQGRYALGGLSPGAWSLTADAPDFSPSEQALTLLDGQPPLGVDFTLAAAASVFGTCYAEDGSPAPGSSHQFLWVAPDGRRDGEPPRVVRADAEARYEVRDLRPGTWSISGDPPLMEVTLAAGERLELDLRVPPAARISGRVLFADGTLARNAWVFAHATPKVMGGTIIMQLKAADAEGRYEVRPAYPGHYDLVAAVAAPDSGMSALLALELGDAEQRVVDLQLGGLSVAGRVIDTADGAPVAGARVFALPLLESGRTAAHSWVGTGGEGWNFSTVSGSDGGFELKNLAPGRYSLGATLIGARVQSQPPLVLGSSPLADIELRVTRTGSIAGTAHLQSGVPVKNSTILSAQCLDQKQTALTEDGRFELRDLLPGSWRLSVMDGTAILAEQSVTVVSGRQAQVELIVP